MPKLCERDKCSGCGSCKAVCPVNAIKICQDRYGFYKAEVDEEKCISCGKCEKSCPPASKSDYGRIPHEAFAIAPKDTVDVHSSASGGVFYRLATRILQEGGKVYGAVSNADHRVVIQEIHSEEELIKACGSKYVQSQTGEVYQAIKKQLEEGHTVLFSGLPCQVAGLYSSVGEGYEKLYTCEIVCHGVPSEMLMLNYIHYLEKKENKNVVKYLHRYKKGKFRKLVAITSYVEYDDGSVKICDSADDAYLIAFRNEISLGLHCNSCQFSSPYRGADITMGDFLGVGTYTPCKLDITKGVSMLLVNSPKGDILKQKIENDYYWETKELKECLMFNTNLRKPTKHNAKMEQFYETVLNEDFDAVRKKYLDKEMKSFCTKWIRRVVRFFIKDEWVCLYMKMQMEKAGTDKEIQSMIDSISK